LNHHDTHIGSRFSGAAKTQSDRDIIASQAAKEVADKEARLLSFYENPYGNGEEQWHLERILWDYLCEYKVPEKTRKDNATISKIHELDHALMAKVFLQTGYLPHEVTYQIINGAKILLPPEQRPIGNLFCAVPIHDRDEEDPYASTDTLIQYSNDRITDLTGLSENKKIFLRQRVDFIADVSEAITFGRKTHDDDGNVIKEETHGGNLDTCMASMQDHWPAIGEKALDALGGTITRFSRIQPKSITPNRTKAYIDEKLRMYMIAQPLEDMQDRYPQLAPYFEIMNAKLRVAVVSVQAMIQHHPELSKKHFKPRDYLDTETATITIHRDLKKSMQLAPWTPQDICDMTCLIEGLEAEALRTPQLQPIVDQISEQANPYLRLLGSSLKIKPEGYVASI